MATYSIGIFEFVRWQGVPPPLVKQHVVPFNKIGLPGVGAIKTGNHGDPFDVTLSAVFANKANAILVEESYRDLIGASPATVVYDNLDYFLTYFHSFLVVNVETISIKAHPLLLGPGYSYPGGTMVRSHWQMIPISTAPIP